jgi:hypothetical protein
VTIEALGNIGDFVGGVGVIVTLLYLASQIRQNTRALDVTSRQDVADRLSRNNRLQLDPRLARAFVLGLSDYPNISFDERSIFSILMGEQTTALQGVVALYEAGTLQEETYAVNLEYVASLLTTPGGARWWVDWSPIQPGSVVRAINDRLARGGLPDPREHDNYRLDDLPDAQQGAAADSA